MIGHARGEHPYGFGQDRFRVRDVLQRVNRENRFEVAVCEGQMAHIGHSCAALLSLEGTCVDVDADRLPRFEQVVAVTDAAAQVEHESGTEKPLAETVGGDVPLPGRVETGFRGDYPLSGHLQPTVTGRGRKVPVEVEAPIGGES